MASATLCKVNKFPFRLILSDVRSAGNVGAILRTADACNVELVYACGYTPYPTQQGDERPAHVADGNSRAIAKTALGAELTVPVLHSPDTATAIREAKHKGFMVIVLEQSENSLSLYQFRPSGPIALVLGNEVDGVQEDVLYQAQAIIDLPMLGAKESLNVAVAAGIAMYQLRFGNPA
jgi:23S rRNA (guanosine2251-2'-O)-methyltransferase